MSLKIQHETMLLNGRHLADVTERAGLSTGSEWLRINVNNVKETIHY